MIKCTKGQVRRLKTALRWKIPTDQRQRIETGQIILCPARDVGSNPAERR